MITTTQNLNPLERALHERALFVAKKYRETEAELLDILQKIDEKRVFRALGYASLFQYALSALKLSEANASNFIAVSRKAREIPEIKAEIQAGNLSVAKARKILPVIQKDNAKTWIDLAKTLPKPKLEREVAKVCPAVLTPEKSKYVAENRLSIQCGVSEEVYERLSRVKDLLSQKKRKAVSLEEALGEMVDQFLEKHDPVVKAKRCLEKKETLPTTSVHGHTELAGKEIARPALPARIKHEVMLANTGQCAHVLPNGERCDEKRWLDMHHVISRSNGGSDTAENLTLLCFSHHRGVHDRH